MFLNFQHFSLSVLKQNVGYQSWNSQNACKTLVRMLLQKQSYLGLPCLSRPFWQGTRDGDFRTFTIMYHIKTDKG